MLNLSTKDRFLYSFSELSQKAPVDKITIKEIASNWLERTILDGAPCQLFRFLPANACYIGALALSYILQERNQWQYGHAATGQ